jgi:steroid 5-alpha reductase family enzyme
MGAVNTAAPSRAGAVAFCVVAYVVAGAAALGTGYALRPAHPLLVAAAADLVATLVVFLFSVTFDNSSFYDPYWSIAPIPLALFWTQTPLAAGASLARQCVVVALVTCWGARLTWNWLRGWTGLEHEDWRYLDLRARSGRAYWLVSFVGIHLFPTIIVFLGCLAVYVAVAAGHNPFGLLDLVACVVTGGAIVIEAIADEQLRRFRRTAGTPGRTLVTGLWARSRHPNYLGETSFWWGLFLFALAASPSRWWTIAGPLAITLMFLFVSIPMIDRRMLARRSDYADLVRRLPALVPRLR